MEVIDLAWWKLGLAALLVLALAGTGYLARLGITRNLLIKGQTKLIGKRINKWINISITACLRLTT